LARYWGNLLVKERAAYLSKSLGPFFFAGRPFCPGNFDPPKGNLGHHTNGAAAWCLMSDDEELL